MSLPRHWDYKPVEFGWLSELPSHWEVFPLKRAAELGWAKRDVAATDQYVGLENVSSWTGRIAAAEVPAEGLGIEFNAGDVLFGKLRPYLAKVALADMSGIASTEFLVLRGKQVDPNFLRYSMVSRPFIDAVNASTYGAKMPRASWEDIGSLPQPIPPPAEQRAIAEFLDRETAKIDALVNKQEELIERIEEKRKSLIAHAVTKGLNAECEFRDSGVEWIGPVPAHWPIMRVKHVAKLESGHTPSKSVPEYWIDCDIPWVSLNDSKQLSNVDYISDTAERINRLGIENSSARLLPARSVVFTRDATVGLSAITTRPMAVSQHLIAWVCGPAILPEYLLRVIYAMKGELDRLTAGATIKTIGLPLIGQLTTPVPPLDEQRAIVAAVEGATKAAADAIGLCEQMLARLREHRAAIITAATTGQIAIAVDARSDGQARVAANDNRHAFRAVVGAEIVSRHGGAKAFGRVKLQKLLYLAEVHAGIHELAGTYTREAAGPLARELLSDTERGMAAAAYYDTVAPVVAGDGYTYSRIGKAGAHRDQLAALLGPRGAALTKVIDLLKDYDTRQVEAITTLYAVWNDALLDGETANDDRIIRGVLEEWHPEKPEKFTPADLKTWLAWMRRNGLLPTGSGPRTQIDRLFV